MAEGLVLHEHRRLSRKELIYYLKLVDCKTGTELGRLGDIHSEGMLIFSPEPLVIGSHFELDLELPKAMAAEGRGVRLECEVVWTRPGPKNSTYHEAGLRFGGVDTAQQKIIALLTDLFAMPGQ